MSADDPRRQEPEPYEVEPSRSIFSAMWFRVLLVVVALGVVAAVAVPYVLEWMSPPIPMTTAAKPAPAMAPAPAPAPALTAPPPPAPVMTAPEPKESPPAAAVVKPAPPAKRARKEPARRTAKAMAKAPAATDAYWVQVGAFKDPAHATRVAARLREAKFAVEETAGALGGQRAAGSAPGAGDTYDVFVVGGSVADVSTKLAAKGLATQASGNGVVVKPSLSLRDAVALSKDLASEGFRVQVRRAGGVAAPAPEASTGGDTLHRVRVGPFPDRAAALQALNALKERGYKDGFIARGGT